MQSARSQNCELVTDGAFEREPYSCFSDYLLNFHLVSSNTDNSPDFVFYSTGQSSWIYSEDCNSSQDWTIIPPGYSCATTPGGATIIPASQGTSDAYAALWSGTTREGLVAPLLEPLRACCSYLLRYDAVDLAPECNTAQALLIGSANPPCPPNTTNQVQPDGVTTNCNNPFTARHLHQSGGLNHTWQSFTQPVVPSEDLYYLLATQAVGPTTLMGIDNLSVEPIELDLVKTVDDANPDLNDVVTFTITVTNDEPYAFSGICVEDEFPAKLQLVDIGDFDTYDAQTGILKAEVDVPAGPDGEVVLSFTARVLDECPITNCAVINRDVTCTEKRSCVTLNAGQVPTGYTHIPPHVSTLTEAISLTYLPAGTANMVQIYLEGDLTIDAPSGYTFTGSQLLLGAGARIIVPGGSTLTIANSTLSECALMWRSVLVETGGTLVMTGSTLEGAERAVDARDQSILNIQDCTFQRNYIGLQLTPTQAYGLYRLKDLTLWDNTFTTGGTLPSPGPGAQIPALGNRSYAGIHLENFHLLDLQGATPNTFTGLSNGVVALSSRFSMSGATFSDIQPDGAYAIDGNGIYLAGRPSLWSAPIGGLVTDGMSWTNCATGIQAQRASLTMRHATMTGMQTGLLYANPLGSSLIVEDGNNITASKYGIRLDQTNSTGRVQIENNSIYILNSGPQISAGISAVGTQFPNFWPVILEDNAVSIIGPGHAFDLNAVRDFQLLSNDGLIGLETAVGFRQAGCSSNYFYCNHSSGPPPENGGSTASVDFLCETSNSSRYDCNKPGASATGMEINGFCPMENRLQRTQFGWHSIGLHYTDANAQTGPQEYTFNYWNQPAQTGGWNALHGGGFSPALNSLYFTSNLQGYSPYSVNPGSGWFILQGTATETCPSECSQPLPEDTVFLGRLDTLILADSLAGSLYSAQTQVLADRYLYHKLTSHPDLADSTSVFAGFVSSLAGSEIARLDSVWRPLRDGQPDSLQREVWVYLDSLTRHLTDSLADLQAQLAQASPQDSLILLADRANLYVTLEQADSSLIAWQDQWAAQRQGIDSLARVAWQSFSPQSDWATAEHWILGLHLLEGGVPDRSTVQDSLHTLATGCWSDYGLAVYLARSLLDTVIRDTTGLCLGETFTSSETREAVSPDVRDIRIFPNPTTGQITLQGDIPAGSVLEIIDGLGQVRLSQPDMSPDQRLLLPATWPDGPYWLRLRDTRGGLIHTQSILLQRD